MGSSLNVMVGVLHAQLPLNTPHSMSVRYLIESIKARSTIMTLKTSQYYHLQGCILNHIPPWGGSPKKSSLSAGYLIILPHKLTEK